MSLAYKTIVKALESHAQKTGLFLSTAIHEPKDAPGKLHCAFYVAGIRPYPQGSGLNKSSAVVTIMGRVYVNMIQEPQDDIDPAVVAATDTLMQKYSTDNTLGSNLMTIDLLGMSGEQLAARAGYINVGGTMFRSMDITIPCIVVDAWTQGS